MVGAQRSLHSLSEYTAPIAIGVDTEHEVRRFGVQALIVVSADPWNSHRAKAFMGLKTRGTG